MKFIKELLLSVLKSLLLFIIASVAVLSFLQQKFPPKFTDPSITIQKFRALADRLATIDTSLHAKLDVDPNKLVTSRQNIIKDVEKIDPAFEMKDKKKDDRPGMDKVRLDVAEYKIRLLEYEISVLKNEVKKLKLEKPIK